MKKIIKIGIPIFILIIVYIYVLMIESIPNNITIFQGENIQIKQLWGIGLNKQNNEEIVEASSNKNQNTINQVNTEKIKISLLDKINIKNVNIDIFKADISKRSEAKELVKYVLEKYNKIDILINNAGISQIKEFTQITDEDWNNMINVNLNSVFYMTQEVIPNMIHNKKGCIINMSSAWGVVGGSLEVIYSVSKAGLDGLTKALAKELGPSNIRVNSIAPGMINTKMNDKFNKEEPSDIAKCVKWLIEDTYTTGQVISINGGWIIT